jgi:hypothetical protein
MSAPTDTVTCTGCGDPCHVVEVDFGIGAYEYWGAPGFDSRIERVSNCCEAPVSGDDEDDDPPLGPLAPGDEASHSLT